jgi:hypothetical protein
MNRPDKTVVRTYATVLFLLASALCFAEPFLVSDPYPKKGDQPTRFSIVAGQLKLSVPAEKLPDGTVRLRFDLSQLPDGEQILEIKAVNEVKKTESGSVSIRLLKKNGKEVTLVAPREESEKQKIPPSRSIGGLLRP